MSKAARLKGTEIADARKAFESVFRSSDPFDAPFTASVEARALLYPVEFELDRRELQAIASAAAVLGEREALLSTVEGVGRGPSPISFEDAEHWRITLEPNAYQDLERQGWSGIMETGLYSAGGDWGLLISHEQHALVGGPRRFLDALRGPLPDGEEQLQGFLARWKDNHERHGSDIEWIHGLLHHVYGADEADRQLRRAGIERK